MSSLLFWRTTPTDEAPSVSCEDALADLGARLAATPTVEAQLRSGGETGLAPPGAGLGPQTLRRWLVAEKWDVDAAFGRLVTHAQWRADYVPRGFIGADEVTADLACGKCFIQGTGPGRAAAGHPLLVVLVARHSKAASGADAGAATKRFVCWCLDVAAAACDPATNPAGAVCGLFDFRDVSMDCLDIPALKAIFGMLQAHFPERLDRLVMFAAPSIFLGLWRVLAPFLDAKTRGKVCFVQAGEDVGAALPHVAAAALPAAYGGQAELVSITCAAEQVGMMGAAAAAPPPPSPAVPPAPDARPPSGASAAAPRDGDGAVTDDGSELEAAVEAELAKANGGGGVAGEAAGGGGGLVAAAMVS